MEKRTLASFLGDKNPETEMDLVELSDRIWELGDINIIHDQLEDDAFYTFVMMNIMGIWKGDGWGGILENESLLPYVESALKVFELEETAQYHQELMLLFPVDPYDDSVLKVFFDHHNFLISPRFKVQDPRLQVIDREERRRLSISYQRILPILDDLSEAIWAYDAPKLEGWQMILDRFR
ncbi:hypothetical protein MMG00_09655 [Ignatzschineria rhizosphaerae]|uniref:DUF4375 domain-containing protein n=1 Tax=Ignatzschineria rhizosphaerae TaxID=2923279 RepID=A0ABY3X400_9GAMM|nr:hypothetical protein [Ignatzschineria rhizosphaerae]UNM95490.1 hypothetical protein MMG00_09655 [Ignatzschineria rhizosphaerae]